MLDYFIMLRYTQVRERTSTVKLSFAYVFGLPQREELKVELCPHIFLVNLVSRTKENISSPNCYGFVIFMSLDVCCRV